MRIQIPFSEQRTAEASCVAPEVEPARALAGLALPTYRAVVVVHGGASAMAPRHEAALQRWAVALAPLAERQRILIVDGGTDVGAARALGAARQQTGGTYPLLGVVPRDRAAYPGGPPVDSRRYSLNPWHTHFLLVEGETFGVESALLVGLLAASDVPGVAVIANGGRVVLDEAQAHAAQGNLLVVLRGSGRAADALASPRSRARAALPSGARLECLDVAAPARFAALLNALLASDYDGGS